MCEQSTVGDPAVVVVLGVDFYRSGGPNQEKVPILEQGTILRKQLLSPRFFFHESANDRNDTFIYAPNRLFRLVGTHNTRSVGERGVKPVPQVCVKTRGCDVVIIPGWDPFLFFLLFLDEHRVVRVCTKNWILKHFQT